MKMYYWKMKNDNLSPASYELEKILELATKYPASYIGGTLHYDDQWNADQEVVNEETRTRLMAKYIQQGFGWIDYDYIEHTYQAIFDEEFIYDLDSFVSGLEENGIEVRK